MTTVTDAPATVSTTSASGCLARFAAIHVSSDIVPPDRLEEERGTLEALGRGDSIHHELENVRAFPARSIRVSGDGSAPMSVRAGTAAVSLRRSP